MAPMAAGSPFRPRSRGPRATTPPPPLPPKPKASPMTSRSTAQHHASGSQVARRAFFADVVVEHPTDEVNALLERLGQAVEPISALPAPQLATATPSRIVSDGSINGGVSQAPNGQEERIRHMRSLIEELVRTDRSYVSRLTAMKTNYADPLRHFAKQANTNIIPMYQAKTLFGNIDAVLPAAVSFLQELEIMWASGHPEQIIGDVCLKHLKDLKTMDPYRTYIANQDEAQKMFQEVFKKFAGFVNFIENTKYKTTGIGNIGLRELLMEPVQRIPRYTLLWQAIAKCMSPLSDQRAKLQEATAIASRIARCEADEQTVRATVMYCLQRNIDGFPANLFSNNRNYLDSVDTDDVTVDGVSVAPRLRPRSVVGTASSMSSLGSSAASILASPQKDNSTPPSLHCTIFLFDDKLMITKRQSSSTSGRKATGLDDVRSLVKSGGGIAVKEKDGVKKTKLSYRGVVDVANVMAVDLGDGDFKLYMEQPPSDQSERWALPLRSFTTVHPPHPIGLDMQTVRADKERFLHSIWTAQALARTKVLPSQAKAAPKVLVSHDDVRLSEEAGRAHVFWCLWDPAGWESEPSKAKVKVEVVCEATAAPIPEVAGDVSLVIRLQPVAGELCHISYVSKMDRSAKVLLQFGEVHEYVTQIIHNQRVFAMPSNNPTPTMVHTPSTLGKRSSRLPFGSSTASSRSGGRQSDDCDSTSTKGGRSIGSRTSAHNPTSRPQHDKVTISAENRALPHLPDSVSHSPISAASPPTLSPTDTDPFEGQQPSQGVARSGETVKAIDSQINARIEGVRQDRISVAAFRSPTSRVAAMRARVEAREQDARAEAASRARTSRSPELVNEPKIPTLASSITAHGGQVTLSRDSSMASLPQSPTKGNVTRTDTLSPRGPRTLLGQESMVARSTGGEVRAARALPVPPAFGTISPAAHSSPQVAGSRLIGLGTAPKLRVISGGRKSLGDDRTAITPAQKRQHPAEHLSPRKRVPSDSPMSRRDGESAAILDDARPAQPHESGTELRRTSGRPASSRSTRRSSGVLTPSRRVSAISVASASSISSVLTVCQPAESAVIMSAHPTLPAAADSIRQKIDAAQKRARRLHKELYNLAKAAKTSARALPLPRSPADRNIHGALSPVASVMGHEEGIDLDTLRALLGSCEKMEALLGDTLADSERIRMLTRTADDSRAQDVAALSICEGQLARAKEREDLLRRQIAEREMEIDEIYNAFNVELDGMYSDITLPTPEGVHTALQTDLQRAKASRNDLALENHRLRAQLEEERLKSAQLSAVLDVQGVQLQSLGT